jgi:hypothetical protein
MKVESNKAQLKHKSPSFAKPVLCVCAFWKWLKELPYSECPKFNKKGVIFSHEEHFTAGSPNVYHCKFCNEYFI